MYQLVLSLLEPATMLSLFASIAVFATIMTLAGPILQKDNLGARMKSVATERENIRIKERARLNAENSKGGSLRETSGGAIHAMVEKLNLRTALADEKTFANLVMAGYRKKSHIYVFLFFRLVLPILFLIGAVIYVFWFSNMDRPFMVKLMVVLITGYAGFYAPNVFVQNRIKKRQKSISRAWPDALDLMLICVESGMSLEASLRKVAVEIGLQSIELAEELTLTTAELSYLQDRRDAHENFATRTGVESVKAVSMALIQAEKYGTPLGTALRALSKESRAMRMSEAEKKAAALPPMLTVPMIAFFLPVLFAVILGPAIMTTMAL